MHPPEKSVLQQALEALIPLSNAHFPDERECLSDEDVRQAGCAVAALHQAIAQSVEPTGPASGEISWTVDAGEFPVHYSMSLASAAAELQKLYQEWPGGLDEIESALRTKKAQSVEAAESLNKAERQSWEMHLAQAQDIRALLDLHAPETTGNLQTRLKAAIAQPSAKP